MVKPISYYRKEIERNALELINNNFDKIIGNINRMGDIETAITDLFVDSYYEAMEYIVSKTNPDDLIESIIFDIGQADFDRNKGYIIGNTSVDIKSSEFLNKFISYYYIMLTDGNGWLDMFGERYYEEYINKIE